MTVPVISAESLLLSRSPKVTFINSVLQYCLDAGDRTLKFEILDYLLNHDHEVENEFDFLMEHLQPEGQRVLYQIWTSMGIEFSPGAATSMSVYEAVEYIIRTFALGEHLMPICSSSGFCL